jgi:hypothetical protein
VSARARTAIGLTLFIAFFFIFLPLIDPHFGTHTGSWVGGEKSMFRRLEDGIGQFLALVILCFVAVSPLIVVAILDRAAPPSRESATP